jgi:hypothetical protein
LNSSAVLAFAFGVPGTIRSNQQIAQIAMQYARQLEAPVYTQLDVCIETGIEVVRIAEKPGDPPPTLRIARGAIQWAIQRGFNTLWIVAAKPQLWRAIRDVTEAVREAGVKIEIHACPEIEQYPADSWFCPESTQPRVRSRKEWDNRERILKLMPFWLYRRIAK